MCDPVTAGLILTAVGTGTQAVNQNVALRRQDREAARGIRRQGEIQRESNEAVNEAIEDLAASTGAGERAEALEGFQNALRASDDATFGALPGDAAVGGANQRFAERVGRGAKDVRGRAGEQAGRLATIDAATFQRINEGARRGRTATDINDMRRRAAAEDFITQLRISERRPNEFVNALGSALSGAGSAMAMGGGIPNFMKGGPNLGKLAAKGTIIDAPLGTPGFNPFAEAARFV